MRSHLISRFLSLLLLILLLAPQMKAQSGGGAITGSVTDVSGADAPKAKVTATNQDTGVKTSTQTTSSGDYRIPHLPPGHYQVSASLRGFKTAVRDNIEVLLSQTVDVDFRLEVGEISQSITVSAETPLLESGTMEIGTNATLKEIHTWPTILNEGTRQLQSFVFRTMPGTQGNEWSGSINGGQAFSHEILIDGISLGRMDINGGSNVEFTPNMDAVNEFKLQVGALSAQYGSTQTAVTSFGLKSGTNKYHGTLFEFHTNSALNANSWSSNEQGIPKQPMLENNFGATIGGPIFKDRTHFYFSYEGDRYRDHTIIGRATIPLREYKEGDFSRLLDPIFTGDERSGTVVGQDALGRDVIFGQIYDPTTSRQLPDGTWIRDPFPGNIIPRDRYSKVTSVILEKYDIPDALYSTFRRNYPSVALLPRREIDTFSLKLDHVLTSAHKISASAVRENRNLYLYGGPGLMGVPLPGPPALGSETRFMPGWIVRFAEDWTVSPTQLNHFAFGYNRFLNKSVPGVFEQQNWAAALGLQGVAGTTFPRIDFRGRPGTLMGGLRSLGNSFNSYSPNGSAIWQDDFTWLKGHHSFRLGFEHRRYFMNDKEVMGAGNYTFDNTVTALPGFVLKTGFSYAGFLLGAVAGADLPLHLMNPGIRSRSTISYFQDDWKLKPKLTLNLGIRWDIPEPPFEVNNRMSGLDPNLPNPGAGGRPGALVFLGNCKGCTGKSTFAGTYYREFSPRVGFAYEINRKLVIRGGYGINFAPPILNGFGLPYFAGYDADNVIRQGSEPSRDLVPHYWDNPFPRYPVSLPNTDPSVANGGDIAYYPPQAQKDAYVQNWNLGIQYEFPWKIRLEVNYIGNKGTHLNEGGYEDFLNQVNPAYLSLGEALQEDISAHPEIPLPYPGFTGSVAQALRPYPQYQSISTHKLNFGFSKYHSLQATLTKRSETGLSFLAAYTFSKALGTSDNALRSYGYGGYGGYGQDFYNRRADYSVTSFNFPQDLKLSWIYDLPFGAGRSWLKSGVWEKILGRWTVSGIQRYRSGNPLMIDPSWIVDHEALFNPTIRQDVLLPRSQQVIGEKPDNPDPVNGTPYLNPAAFADPPMTGNGVPVHLGNAPRYLPNLRGFASFGEDLSLLKRAHLGRRESTNLELRIDVSNLFNRVSLADPITDHGDPSFGNIIGKVGTPRNIQVGLRVNF